MTSYSTVGYMITYNFGLHEYTTILYGSSFWHTYVDRSRFKPEDRARVVLF